MPLRDHFHSPLDDTHPWEGFHSAWANAIVIRLNEILPERCYAMPTIRLGVPIEVDVIALREEYEAEQMGAGAEGGVGTAVEIWSPPAAPISCVADFSEPDLFEVRVMIREGGPRVVSAIELVSPGNKDREETRRGFAAKCASYLQAGVSLVVVDVVPYSR